MCEDFNEFFINVGPTLNKNIHPQATNASDFIERLKFTLYFDIHINNSSAGWDDIYRNFLKQNL